MAHGRDPDDPRFGGNGGSEDPDTFLVAVPDSDKVWGSWNDEMEAHYNLEIDSANSVLESNGSKARIRFVRYTSLKDLGEKSAMYTTVKETMIQTHGGRDGIRLSYNSDGRGFKIYRGTESYWLDKNGINSGTTWVRACDINPVYFKQDLNTFINRVYQLEGIR